MVIQGANPFPKESADLYRRKRWWLDIPLGELLDRTCDLYPHKEALVSGEVRLTFQQLREQTDRAALAFLEIGIQKLDRVLLQIPNWAEFVYAYYGLHKMGAIPVMCIPRFSQREIEHFCETTEARAWIVPLQFEKIDYRPMIEWIRSREPLLKHIIIIDPTSDRDRKTLPEGAVSFHDLLKKVDFRRYPKDYLQSHRPDPDEICHLMPTGGTTGLPKLVPRAHNDYFCNFDYRAKAWERSPHDVTLIATPLTHNMATEVSLNPSFLTGGKVVVLPSTRPKDILEAIEKEKVTTTILAVAQVQQIIDFPELERYDVSSLKVIATGGSRMPPELIRKIYDQLKCKFFNVFGMSEGPCTQTRYQDTDEVVFHTVGWPVCPYDEFKVIDANGNDLPRGVEGELVVRGPCIFRGYYKAEAENREAFTLEGFLRTGDIAKLDPEGRLIITGRKKDIIIRGGENISAREVEDLIGDYPKVEQVSVVGMPDPVLGEKVCAFIKPKRGETIIFEELIAHLRGKKTSVLYLPERIEMIDEIPLTNVGKVDKKRLREDIKEKLKKEGKI
ncbi:MAG: AMP-binding protein [Deltaproteobacteria bacterium]|nr:AMP-binding protein [Deltaproteobacteria bacterium]